jgi:hypothetical protein
MIPPALSRALVSAARGHPFRRDVGSARPMQAITIVCSALEPATRMST